MNYSAYTLAIKSDISLPLPINSSGDQPDISITVGKSLEPENLSRTSDGVWYAHMHHQLYLRWDRISDFLIKDGKKIVVTPSKNSALTKTLLSAPLLGTVMASVMHQMGRTVLHGSSVLIDGKAVVFVGKKGEGKSTIAAHFRTEGHPLISDDVCALDMESVDGPQVSPSFSTIKLWPDAMQHLNYKPEDHEKVHPQFEKRCVRLDNGFTSSSSRVAAIVILKTGPYTILERLSGHSALPELLPHLIANRFPEGQLDSLKKNIYYQLVKILDTIPVYQLVRPRDMSLLPTSVKLVRQKL